MSQEYQLSIDGQKFNVKVQRLDEGGLLVVQVGTQSFTLKPAKNDDGSWTINDTSADHVLKVLSRSGTKVSVEVNGTTREVDWSRIRKETTTVSARAGAGTASGTRVEGGVYPPMPGKITEVSVNVGDEVKSGDTVCVLEAMKMFNELKAPRDGVVKEVNVEPGAAVTPNDLLVLIE